MTRRSKFIKGFSVALFILGLLMTTIMAFVFFWPDMEASLFDASTTAAADKSLRGLRCPYIMTAEETSQIRAVFTNSEDQDVSFIVRSRISQGYVSLMRQDSEIIRLAPNERHEVAWPVTMSDAAYGRLIMARVFTTRSAAAPAQQSSCGILVINVTGITGQQLVILGLATNLLLLAIGGGLWLAQERPLNRRSRSIVQEFGLLTCVILSSLVAGFLNWWLVSLLLLILAILLVGALLDRFSR